MSELCSWAPMSLKSSFEVAGQSQRSIWPTTKPAMPSCCGACSLAPRRILMEATGGYEQDLALALVGRGLQPVVNLARYATSRAAGKLVMTDRIAQISAALLRCSMRKATSPCPADDEGEFTVQAGGAAGGQRAASERQRLGVAHRKAKPSILAIMDAIAAHRTMSMASSKRTCPGPPRRPGQAADLGQGRGADDRPHAAGAIPELGQLNGKQITALVGLAPMNRDRHRPGAAPSSAAAAPTCGACLRCRTVGIALQPHPQGLLRRCCWPQAKPRRSRWWPACTSCWSILNAIARTRSPWRKRLRWMVFEPVIQDGCCCSVVGGAAKLPF